MRRLFALLGTAGVALVFVSSVVAEPAVASAAQASGNPISINTTVTATATGYDVHSGMAACSYIAGTAAMGTLGNLGFTGDYCEVGPRGAPGTYANLTLNFADGNGDRFSITGSGNGADPNAQPWTASSGGKGLAFVSAPQTLTAGQPSAAMRVARLDGAGRFAGITGSGTFALGNWSTPSTLTFPLTGTLTLQNATLPSAIRVNAGGGAYTDAGGSAWSADCCFSGGSVATTAAAISGTSDPTLYKDERWYNGPFTYTFSGLSSGSYGVTLKFAEISYLGPGKRQFNVAINGSPVLTNFDVAAQVGFNKALEKTFTATVGSNGQLTVTFSKGAADNPIISAIQLVPQAAVSNLAVSLSSDSPGGQFATSTSGPWPSTLSVTIPAGQTASGSFYYRDTKASEWLTNLTASAAGYSDGVQEANVNAATPLIHVNPGSVTVRTGASQPFTATADDQYGNPVDTSSATWSTTAPGTLFPLSGSGTTFTAGSSAGSGKVTATVGAVSGSATATVSGAASVVRVNAGGAAYTDTGGNAWSADCCNSGGNTFSTTAAISGTSDPTLYRSERWYTGPFTYTFSGLGSGSYNVTLKFAEIAANYGPGKRQFNVAINGTQVLTNLDVAAQVGFNTALDKTFPATVGSNGQLTVAFSKGALDSPIVSAIQVVPAGSASLSFLSAPQTLTAGQPSAAMQISASNPPASNLAVSLSSSSTSGQFATSSAGPWSSTLSVSIPAGQTTSGSFYYKDTWPYGPDITASATGCNGTSQQETVHAAALASITLSPGSAALTTGGNQQFSASGQDQYGNGVDTSSATWSTTAPGTVSPLSGSTSTFTAGSSAGSGKVTATIGAISGSATVTVSSASLSLPAAQTLTAGQPSAAMQVKAPQAQASNLAVSLSSNSSTGQFSASAAGPWSSTLTVTIPAGQTTSGNFYYKDTAAGSPSLSVTANGYGGATQQETVSPAALASITLSPNSATLTTGGNQWFSATGNDQYNNYVAISNATWSTTAPGTLSPLSGSGTTFTAGSSAGSGNVTATVGAISGSATATITAAAPTTALRVNAGGAAYTDTGGNAWSADCCNSGGNTYATTAAMSGTGDSTLYQSERWLAGSFTYTFTGLASGSYNVTLKFAEIAYLGPGKRQFNVTVNGSQVLTNFDVAAQVGLNKALDKTFTATVGSNGQLTVTFSKGAADNPIVSAIQVAPA
jgi:hypothetical protein